MYIMTIIIHVDIRISCHEEINEIGINAYCTVFLTEKISHTSLHSSV